MLAHFRLRSSLRSEVLPYVVQKQFAKTNSEQNVTTEGENGDLSDIKGKWQRASFGSKQFFLNTLFKFHNIYFQIFFHLSMKTRKKTLSMI